MFAHAHYSLGMFLLKRYPESMRHHPSISRDGWGIQWTLVITNSLGPVNYFVILNFCYIRVAKTIKYKEILTFGTKKITLLYQDFIISVFFITRVHCTETVYNLPSHNPDLFLLIHELNIHPTWYPWGMRASERNSLN